MNQHKCPHCDKVSNSVEELAIHVKAKHPAHAPKEKKQFITASGKKKIKMYGVAVLIIVIVVWGFSAVSNKKSLPPTTMQGHIEVLPESQVLKVPIRPEIFKHVLEHYDGESRPGVIITYDCERYECAPDLISKLVAFTTEKQYVFVAPFKNQKAKIVVTSLGRQIKLDEFDEEEISRFVG